LTLPTAPSGAASANIWSVEAEMKPIYLVTGIMASGKSTVAQALAARLARSVHVRGDTFRRFIVSGRAEMTLDPSDEARAQLRLRYELAAETACRYVEAGFAVVLQDIVIGVDLTAMIARIRTRPLHVIVLAPAVQAVAAREAGRAKTGYGSMTPEELDGAFRASTPRVGLWLDTTELSVEQTVDHILGHPNSSRVQ
jgi:predicted kinase